ncbi:hypothetical protein PINS_up010865 [Pythium insidiosum]|nr:hypothetical protein PINS_up010865 [Pythium insidiosum]
MRPSKTRAFDDTSSSNSSSSSSSSSIESAGSDGSSGEESRGRRAHSRGRPRQEEDARRLQRLRRIFLSKPTTAAHKSPQRRTSQRRRRPRERDSSASDSSQHSSSSDAVSERVQTRASKQSPGSSSALTLSVDEHIQVLCAHVKRMSNRHDSTVQQVYEMLQQGIEELKCLKAQEERTLQSQVRVIEESYALRLDLFEQQYRAKVAEIKEEKRRAIQQQREKCEDAILSTARRLHDQTQRALLSELNGRIDPAPIQPTASELTERHSLPSRRERHDAKKDHATAAPRLSPVSRQKAKLRAMEAKLSAFSDDAVRRVTREMETQRRQHHERRDGNACVHPTPPQQAPLTHDDEISVRPTPLSPLRTRPSYWKKGISREAPDSRLQAGVEEEEEQQQEDAQEDLPQRLNRRFLRADEERELRALRNSIGLAKDWMERHDA